jgi:hypothetical protein
VPAKADRHDKTFVAACDLARLFSRVFELEGPRMSIPNITALKKVVAAHETAPLDDVVRAINIKLNLAVEAANNAHCHRLDAALMLLSLRRRVEAEGHDWWEWQEGKFDRGRKDTEKLLRIAQAADPEAAAELERTQTRERVRALRAERTVRSKTEPPAQDTAEAEPAPDVAPDEEEDADEELSPAEDARHALMALELRVKEAATMAESCLVVLPRIKKSKLKDVSASVSATLAAWARVQGAVDATIGKPQQADEEEMAKRASVKAAADRAEATSQAKRAASAS